MQIRIPGDLQLKSLHQSCGHHLQSIPSNRRNGDFADHLLERKFSMVSGDFTAEVFDQS
jgi:hypothetical protein